MGTPGALPGVGPLRCEDHTPMAGCHCNCTECALDVTVTLNGGSACFVCDVGGTAKISGSLSGTYSGFTRSVVDGKCRYLKQGIAYTGVQLIDGNPLDCSGNRCATDTLAISVSEQTAGAGDWILSAIVYNSNPALCVDAGCPFGYLSLGTQVFYGTFNTDGERCEIDNASVTDSGEVNCTAGEMNPDGCAISSSTKAWQAGTATVSFSAPP